MSLPCLCIDPRLSAFIRGNSADPSLMRGRRLLAAGPRSCFCRIAADAASVGTRAVASANSARAASASISLAGIASLVTIVSLLSFIWATPPSTK